jgi:hypothetical protein
MRFMKRLSEVLTPPPHPSGNRSTPIPTPSGTPRPARASGLTDEDLSAQLRMLVRSLIDVESTDERTRARARTQLTELARSHGAYATAAKIRMVLESMAQDPKKTDRYDFQRVHVLLGEFVFQHLFNEIAAMEVGERQLGPNIFSTYCGDLIEALCVGRGPDAALEMGIHIAERCLLNATDSRERRDIYLHLAEAAARCTRDQLETALRRPHRHHTPMPMQRSGSSVDTVSFVNRGSKCVEYARELYSRVSRIREEFGALAMAPALSRAELRTMANAETPPRPSPALSERLSRHLQFIQSALAMARNSEYLPLVAHLEERGARTLVARMRVEGESPELKERCRTAYESAARHLETQGDRENALGLAPLSVQRYTKALELCTMAVNGSHASVLQEKLASVGR